MKPVASLLLVAVFTYTTYSLDCRKFSFAPACRGIMLKRSNAPGFSLPVDPTVKLFDEELLKTMVGIIIDAENRGLQCVPVQWLKEVIFTVKLPDKSDTFNSFSLNV